MGILAGRNSSGQAPEGSRAATIIRKKDLTSRTGQIDAARRLEPLTKEVGCTLAQLALAWTLRHERVSTAIMGASRPEQVVDNAGAVACLRKISDDIFDRIEREAGETVSINSIDHTTTSRLAEVGRGPHA